MESKKETSYTYKIEDSADRMDDILDANDNDYEDEGNSIPSRDKLTYKNGYYVDVTAIFIDIVDSSKLTDGHKRPTLAKMYRCFLSECVAVMNSYEICKEININGDCVWGVFETPKMVDVEKVIEVAAKLNDMIKLLNYKLKKKKYESISTGIGIDDGNALMVKAGYSGSGLNDVIWMGEVVNSACHLAKSPWTAPSAGAAAPAGTARPQSPCRTCPPDRRLPLIFPPKAPASGKWQRRWTCRECR